ncbi:DUF5522 domain-containing protein [Chitinophaga sp.]|uniref:DUF5522 domain-containing protein n=1 Tax=Chitinophaga sp. TaxID=1869181 RepID=UPI0031CE52D9
MRQPLKENIDFYYNEQGYVVLTEKYHRQRGYCCGNGCLHCPFDYENVPENKRDQLLSARKERREQGGQ